MSYEQLSQDNSYDDRRYDDFGGRHAQSVQKISIADKMTIESPMKTP